MKAQVATYSHSIISASFPSEGTPPKRARVSGPGPARGSYRAGAALSQQMAALLHMPELHSPRHAHCQRPGTPHSILKVLLTKYRAGGTYV